MFSIVIVLRDDLNRSGNLPWLIFSVGFEGNPYLESRSERFALQSFFTMFKYAYGQRESESDRERGLNTMGWNIQGGCGRLHGTQLCPACKNPKFEREQETTFCWCHGVCLWFSSMTCIPHGGGSTRTNPSLSACHLFGSTDHKYLVLICAYIYRSSSYILQNVTLNLQY